MLLVYRDFRIIMQGWGYFFMGMCVQKSIHFFLDYSWCSTVSGKMDFPHDHWISNAAYIITIMRFSCSYFCFGERRLVIMLKARCLSSSPIPKYRFWYSYLLWKMFRDESEFEKLLIMSVKNEAFKCELFGGLFLKGGLFREPLTYTLHISSQSWLLWMHGWISS